MCNWTGLKAYWPVIFEPSGGTSLKSGLIQLKSRTFNASEKKKVRQRRPKTVEQLNSYIRHKRDIIPSKNTRNGSPQRLRVYRSLLKEEILLTGDKHGPVPTFLRCAATRKFYFIPSPTTKGTVSYISLIVNKMWRHWGLQLNKFCFYVCFLQHPTFVWIGL